MMGSAPAGGGGELSFVDVIGMLKDEPAYQTKLREIGNRLNETKALQQQTAEINAKMEETKKFTADMAAKAEAQLVEARQLKDEADKQVAAAVARGRELDVWEAEQQKLHDQHSKDLETHYQAAFATREKEVAAKEQKLLADTKEFEARQADEQAKIDAFMTLKKGTEDKLAQREAALKQGSNELAVKMAEASALKQELKSKLAKFKEVAAS
jgi:hypothetical protein